LAKGRKEAEGRGQREGKRWRAEGKAKTEGRRQRAEGKEGKGEGKREKSDLWPRLSIFWWWGYPVGLSLDGICP
jgi:hypothetical protein